MNITLKYFLVILIGALTTFPFFSHAQLFVPYTLEDAQTESELVITPRYPKLGEEFIVEIYSYAIDLDTSTISFYGNNELLASDVGLRSYNYGFAREKIDIRVVIETVDNKTIEQTQTLIPGSIQIIWEANGYTPPFYEGKKLYTKEGELLVHTLPTLRNESGFLISPQDLIYTWSIDNEKQAHISGRGRNTILLDDIYIGEGINVGVLVRSVDNTVFAEESIFIPHTDPFVVLYENNPLYGIDFGNALNEVFVQDEISIFASPFNFTTNNINLLDFKWSTNNSLVSETSHIITLRNESGKTGRVLLEVLVERINTFFEQSTASLEVNFN